jgi:hypothetical protein
MTREPVETRVTAAELRVGDWIELPYRVSGTIERLGDTPRRDFVVVWVNNLATILRRDENVTVLLEA